MNDPLRADLPTWEEKRQCDSDLQQQHRTYGGHDVNWSAYNMKKVCARKLCTYSTRESDKAKERWRDQNF